MGAKPRPFRVFVAIPKKLGTYNAELNYQILPESETYITVQ